MQPLQHTIPDVLAELVRKAPLSPEKVTFAWRAAVGPAISHVSAVWLSAEGIVEVACAHDQWRREIRRSMPVIKERLVALLGADVVKQIKVPGAGPKRKPGR
jgi:predicted nucleic acid-binding Zn ribbon protein